jgi:putative ABC transport system substrate-binding protein
MAGFSPIRNSLESIRCRLLRLGAAMQRREFIGLVGGAVAWPVAARAQQPERMRFLGVLMGYLESDPAARSRLAAFRETLSKLGWVEGRNLRIELRWGAGDADRIRTLAKELVDLRPDAIFAQSSTVISALARETRTIPIVFAIVSAPIGTGFVASLARPGGNITGFTNIDPEMGGKWVELLKEIAPRTLRVSVLYNPATAVPLKLLMPSIQAAASSSAIEASTIPVHARDEIEGVIAAQANNPGGSLIVTPDPFNFTNRDLMIAVAARYGVPAIYFDRAHAESGGLISYGPDSVERFRSAASYVDRILESEKPAELPVQQATKFELVINLKTAKALGLDVSQSMLARAEEVLE